MHPTTSPTRVRTNLLRAGVVLLAATSLFACSKSDSDGASKGTEPSAASTTTSNGGGNDTTTTAATTGDPTFTSFEVSESVPCEDGNATATMSFTTENVESIEISIDGGAFASTAGYGPNESDVVASIPCTGAASGTIQLKGCSGADVCVESEEAPVTITAA